MIDDWRARMQSTPAGAEISWATAGDGARFRYLTARPDSPKGTIVFVNGRTDFLEKYNETFHDFLAEGWAVAAPEWRGQGLSGRELDNPDKGHVTSYGCYVGDLDRFVTENVVGALPVPYCLIGYSMGGLAASLYLVQTGGAPFSSAILVAPLFRPRTGIVPGWLVRWMTHLRVVLKSGDEYVVGRGDFDFEDAEEIWPKLVTSPERFYEVRAHIRRDPGLRLGGPTWRWLAATFAAVDQVATPMAFSQVRPSLNLIVAELDQLLVNEAARTVGELANARSFTEIPGAQHDLFVERTDIRNLAMESIFGILADLPAAP